MSFSGPMSFRLYLECLGFVLKSVLHIGHLGIPTCGIPKTLRGKNFLHLLQYPYPDPYFDFDCLVWVDPWTSCFAIAEITPALLFIHRTKNR
jgi:hypothetical protein